MKYDLGYTEQSVSRETDKAICFDGDVWVPKKLLTWREHGACYLATAEVPLWFAKQNALVSTGRNPGH